ncbi:MAG: T9SS type A sorting domain-containing protein [Bacteroidales bacterium]|mgnify:CR=1 FL=1|nr:T9SS type A sorting domain-containing protein [Bacteroidales bacterium]HNW72616.1 T9SS type A sorting domain-containing protein [Bacteroidales bacterium]HPS49256.1 T9SS type A sorting domain-containing protein [Bacteroidales bacterium]
MRIFTIFSLLFVLVITNLSAQVNPDNPNLDQIPFYLRNRIKQTPDAPISTVVTINNWDNYSLGVDFAENNMAENPMNPTWYFTAYNTNDAHHTENGMDWVDSSPSFGTSVQGDPVVAYDSLGHLFYENMYGNITGCKVLVSSNNGASWGSPVTAIAGNDKNWIACDQTAGPYSNYAYTVMTNNSSGNFYRSTDNGLTFNKTYTATPHSLPGMMVCVGPNGNIQGGTVYAVSNSGSSAFNSQYTFHVSHDGGATFTVKSTQAFAGTVGAQLSGRHSVQGMRTRPYPMIAADNSYGPNRGRFYCVYATNDPPSSSGYPDIFCRYSTDQGATWSSAIRVNDDPNPNTHYQWHPAIWCDKETGKLYVMWMDTRDCPTGDSALIYASYSVDGGATFVTNQQISNKKMKISCPTCGGGGTPRYQGDYNGIVSNKKVSMLGWTDFRSGTFQSMTAYFPDYAMAVDRTSDTLYVPTSNTIINVSIPEVKLYTDTVILSAAIAPAPTTGSITFDYPNGNTITSFPDSKPVRAILSGSVPLGIYTMTIYAKGPNGTPAHKRVVSIRVLEGSTFSVTATATPSTICQTLMSQLNANVLGGTPPYSYSWTPPEHLNNPASPNPFASPLTTTMYHITVTDNGGNNATDSVLLTVNSAPATPGPIVGIQTICSGDTADYSINAVPDADTYSWTVPADAIILSGQNTISISVKWGTATGDVSVLAGNECGTSLQSVLPVTVLLPPNPLNPVSGPDIMCVNTTATFSTSITDYGEIFQWTVPSDAAITSGQGTNSIEVLWGSTAGNVEVFVYNDCGDSPVVSKSVGVNTAPEPAGIIMGKDTVCQGQGDYDYIVPQIAGATSYVWTLPEGATITSGAGTNEVVLSFSSTALSGNLSVKGSNECGDGVESVLFVQVNNCAGIYSNTLKSAVSIFPNPVNGMLTIKINGNESRLVLTLTDAAGKQIYSEILDNIGNSFVKKLNMSGLSNGTYLLRLSNGSGSYLEKIIVR